MYIGAISTFLRTESTVSTQIGHGATLFMIHPPSLRKFEEAFSKSDTVEVCFLFIKCDANGNYSS